LVRSGFASASARRNSSLSSSITASVPESYGAEGTLSIVSASRTAKRSIPPSNNENPRM
jgi:hypothetical protein